MGNKTMRVDLVKLANYILQRVWLVVLCGVIGFAGVFCFMTFFSTDTYSASGTMYVYNSNPNLVNYQYTDTSDLDSAVQLLETYMVVVKSNKVMDAVAESLSADYPSITPEYIYESLSMGSVSRTGVLKVVSKTASAKLSADICNAVLDVAPAEIIRVVSAGSIEIIDYAEVPLRPDQYSPLFMGIIGAIFGSMVACLILGLMFLVNHKILDEKDITNNYAPPVLSSIKRDRKESKDPRTFNLTDTSPMEVKEGYAKLRMNIVYTMAGKDKKTVVITSAISGEGKSTVAANLAMSCAKSGKKVLLIDGDLRRSRQSVIFGYGDKKLGLSDILIGRATWDEAVMPLGEGKPFVLLAGRVPPNPAELLGSNAMQNLLLELESEFDIILLDAPPINIVSDPLVVSSIVVGCLFVIRQNYTDHREVRKALGAAELMGMKVMGFVFYGENVNQVSKYYGRKYYKDYYKYDVNNRKKARKHRN